MRGFPKHLDPEGFVKWTQEERLLQVVQRKEEVVERVDGWYIPEASGAWGPFDHAWQARVAKRTEYGL